MKNFKAGEYVSQGHYKSFQPMPINRQWVLDDMDLQRLLDQANREIGRLDMYSEYIPNIDLFIQMHVVKEATQSTRIEGTQTNIEEALLDREDIPLNKRDDWEEVQNYIEAINYAIAQLEKIPFSARLIKECHRILLKGVRGENKQLGEFRKSQNWIGGVTLDDAIFIPPIHTSINDLIADLELFVHNQEYFFPELLKIALVHYQFETIHPFLDGNGRVGRLIITLYLVSQGILKKPVLYLSNFFEKNRTYYYQNLMAVRQESNLLQWFKFFLVGVIETAKNSIKTFDNILKLQKQVDKQIQSLGSRTAKAQKVLQYLYQRPVINASDVSKIAERSAASAYKLIADLQGLGILQEMTGEKRGRIYVFQDYLNLFN